MARRPEALLVEDDPAVRIGVGQALELAGLDHQAVGSAEDALALIDAVGAPGALITDLRLPGVDGLTLLGDALARDPALPVVIITGHGDVAMAVSAMRAGAYDFIEKPFASDRLVGAVQRALEKRRLSQEVVTLRRALKTRDGLEGVLIGDSPGMAALRRLIAQIAPTDADVLILGETGAGKEVAARALHQFSPRKAKNFVAINCAALPESVFESEMFGHEAGAFTSALRARVGKLEHASGGTLFLDEIESMPLALQAKLLRALQERMIERLGANRLIPVDLRVVAATKEDLGALAQHGRFRPDLYYRLNVVPLQLPPLRARDQDAALLFDHFALQAAARHGCAPPQLTAEQRQALGRYAWPGNVRELRNVAERVTLGLPGGPAFAATTADPQAPRPTPAAALGAPVPADADDPFAGMTLAERVAAFERAQIEQALRLARGDVAAAAVALGAPKKTLYDKLARHGVSPDRFRGL